MALNKRRVARSRQTSTMQGGKFGRLRDGRNIIRVFSFPHKVSEVDFEMGLYNKNDGYKVGEEFDEIERVASVHFTEDGQVNCLGRGCSFCAESQKYLDSKDKRDQKLGKDLRCNRRFYINAVDMDANEHEVQIWGVPSTVFNDIISYVDDPEYGEDILGCKGRDFIIERDSKAEPLNMYSIKLRDASKCSEVDAALQGDVRDLFRCNALNPGWSSKAELNQSTATPKTDEEKVERQRSKKTARNEKPDYKDDDEGKVEDKKPVDEGGKGEAAPPWEKGTKAGGGGRRPVKEEPAEEEPEFAVGDIVVFKDGDDTFTGPIKEIADGITVVEADESMWDMPFASIKKVPKKTGNQRGE